MNTHYLGGVAFGILGGILTQFGQLLEKWVVNQVRVDSQEKGFIRRLVRSPLWVTGVVFGLGGGTAAYMLAQSMIGPALTPGLMAGGLVVLAVGSVGLNHETLNTSEMIGVLLMVIGILFLGLSRLWITPREVRSTLADHAALLRIAAFTLCFFLMNLLARVLAPRIRGRRGMLIALANGFLSCLSDFWINPLLALFAIVLGGRGSGLQEWIFILAALILVMCGTVITWQNQVAFKYAQASNVVPVAQVPIQIAPVIVYFYIFRLTPPSFQSVLLLLGGTVLTIISGFLLGRRKEVPLELS